jgi:hypothetical protein
MHSRASRSTLETARRPLRRTRPTRSRIHRGPPTGSRQFAPLANQPT